MRLIDADALCEEFKGRQRAALRWKEKAILDGDEERQIRADATLAFLSEVKLTIDNAPTVPRDLCETCKHGDVCKLSTKKLSNGQTTTCYKYEGGGQDNDKTN